jgi:hypothetical protein
MQPSAKQGRRIDVAAPARASSPLLRQRRHGTRAQLEDRAQGDGRRIAEPRLARWALTHLSSGPLASDPRFLRMFVAAIKFYDGEYGVGALVLVDAMAVYSGGGSPAHGGDAGDAGVREEAVSVDQSGDDDASICTYTEESSLGRGSPASDTSLPEILGRGAGEDWEEGHAGIFFKKLLNTYRGLSAWTFREGIAHYDCPMDGGRVSNHMNGSAGRSAGSPLPPLSDPSSLPGSEDVTEDLSEEGIPIDMSPWPPRRTVFSSALNGDARRVASGHREKGVHLTEPIPIVASGAMQSVYVEQHYEISAPESCAAEIQPQQGGGQQGVGSDPATAGDNTWTQMSSPRMHSGSPQEKLDHDSAGASQAEGRGSLGLRHSSTINFGSVQAAHRNDEAKANVRLSHHRHPSLDMNDVRMWSDWRIHSFQPQWKSSFQPEWKINSMPFSWKRCFSRRQEQTQSGHVRADMPTPFKSQMQMFSRRNSFKDSKPFRRIKNHAGNAFGFNCMKWKRKPFESGFTMSKSGKF